MDDIIVLGMLTQVGGTVEFLLGTTNRMDDIIVLGMLTQVGGTIEFLLGTVMFKVYNVHLSTIVHLFFNWSRGLKNVNVEPY